MNAKQKKLLKEWFEKNKAAVTFNFTVEHDLPYELYIELEEINDHETIVQNIEGFIHDLVSQDIDREEQRLTRIPQLDSQPERKVQLPEINLADVEGKGRWAQNQRVKDKMEEKKRDKTKHEKTT